jgi:DNA-binding IclR family transcriptional regulator
LRIIALPKLRAHRCIQELDQCRMMSPARIDRKLSLSQRLATLGLAAFVGFGLDARRRLV